MQKLKTTRLGVIVVVYEKTIKESSTLTNILESDFIVNSGIETIIVWDNSNNKFTVDDLSVMVSLSAETNVDIQYYHCPENLPLSIVYNRCFDILKNDVTHICLFDDDSLINKNYFFELNNVINDFTNDDSVYILLPQIKYKNTVISPSLRSGIRGQYFENVPLGKYYNKNLSAINSGMVCSVKYLVASGFRYDERLTGYGTDDFFMIQYNQFLENHTGCAYILNYIFEHDLSLSMLNDDSEKLVLRYIKLLESKKIIFENDSIKIFIYSLLNSIYHSFRYRNIHYFYSFIKVFLCRR